MNTRSIGFQLTAWYAGVIAVGFVLLGGFMYLGMKHHLEKHLRETQSKRAGSSPRRASRASRNSVRRTSSRKSAKATRRS